MVSTLSNFSHELLLGALLTLKLAVCSIVIGLCLGLIAALGELSSIKVIRLFFISLTSILRGIPELLLLLTIYFGGTYLLTALFGTYIEISAFIAGCTGLGLIFSAYAAEVLRGSFLAIPSGQVDAAKANGFTRFDAFRIIILPQVWRHALPGLGNLWFVLLKDTSLVSLLGLAELMSKTQNAAIYTHDPFLFYSAAAIIYLFFTSISLITINHLQTKINKKYY